MAREIERKFLVRGDGWRAGAVGQPCRQGYLSRDKECVVRVRVIGERAFLAVKGLTTGLSRLEFEYPIPRRDADLLLERLAQRPIIEKTRYLLDAGNGLRWEIDEFRAPRAGLVTAEIELPDAGADFERPDWLGPEVSHDPAYFNSNLSDD